MKWFMISCLLLIAVVPLRTHVQAQAVGSLRTGINPLPADVGGYHQETPTRASFRLPDTVTGSHWKEGGFLAVAIVFVAAYQSLPYRREPGKRTVISLSAASLAFLPGAIIGSWFPKGTKDESPSDESRR